MPNYPAGEVILFLAWPRDWIWSGCCRSWPAGRRRLQGMGGRPWACPSLAWLPLRIQAHWSACGVLPCGVCLLAWGGVRGPLCEHAPVGPHIICGSSTAFLWSACWHRPHCCLPPLTSPIQPPKTWLVRMDPPGGKLFSKPPHMCVQNNQCDEGIILMYPPPPLVQAPPKAQKTTVSLGSGAWTRPVTARGTPGREPFSTRDVSPRPQGVSGTKARTHSAAQHCRTLDSVNLHHSSSCHGPGVQGQQ